MHLIQCIARHSTFLAIDIGERTETDAQPPANLARR